MSRGVKRVIQSASKTFTLNPIKYFSNQKATLEQVENINQQTSSKKISILRSVQPFDSQLLSEHKQVDSPGKM